MKSLPLSICTPSNRKGVRAVVCSVVSASVPFFKTDWTNSTYNTKGVLVLWHIELNEFIGTLAKHKRDAINTVSFHVISGKDMRPGISMNAKVIQDWTRLKDTKKLTSN